MKKISIFLISTTLFSLASLGQNPPLPTMPPEETGAEQMNGIVFKNYIGFEKKYKLVTVRYRTDSGEQRFVYANDIAFKALQKGSTNYPDGAVFAKIGVATKDDPAFLSSKVPGGPQRIQLMVRNKKKYKETGGWGYALFSPRGHTFSNDLQVETKACYACHQLVPDRGQVFSQSFNLSTSWPVKKLNLEKATGSRFAFSKLSVSELTSDIQKLINPIIKEVSLMGGPLRETAFGGTLNEIRPELIAETIRSKQPALFLTLDKKIFLLIGTGDTLSGVHVPDCPSNEKAFIAYWSELPLDKNGQIGLGNTVFCAKAEVK